ncbi:hypothetical protein PT974_10007 [Cladobotryum mycophilum]|uniref:Heterokaryon incompatibility domain-containing protein n=1 Tax=Cladobotryum mycophilum TaxID=491253 RepID=A0ABR0S8M6_9HYPO
MAIIADFGVLAGINSWKRQDDYRLAKKFLMELAVNIPSSNLISAHSHTNSLYFRLLREWLQDCDDNHNGCKLRDNHNFWPKRVIFIGDPDKLTLCEKKPPGQDYVVLSHCWGNPTEEEKRRFCTTPENYHSRLRGFGYNSLPKTFQNAIRVTRELGKQYLWIDAICIIQGHGGDWGSEARTMEDIFACAYCTIAASSAGGWADGFLKPSPDSQYIKMHGNAERLTCACDFDTDVDKGPLMKRAWVLQERVLSRRILHFAATHTYWECGDGVRCERFISLKPPYNKQYFVLDTNFPERLHKAGYFRAVEFVRLLFEGYSRSGLTLKSDRDTAIFSLVKRLGRVFGAEVRYGIVRCFLSTLLLWKRTHGEKTDPIGYGERTMPSWSWMAYSGGIDFISDIKLDLRVPGSTDLEFTDNGKALIVKVRQFKNCQMKEEEGGGKHVISEATRKVGSLWFDVTDRIEFGHCIVVGMVRDSWKADYEKTYYILMVREIPDRGVMKG